MELVDVFRVEEISEDSFPGGKDGLLSMESCLYKKCCKKYKKKGKYCKNCPNK